MYCATLEQKVGHTSAKQASRIIWMAPNFQFYFQTTVAHVKPMTPETTATSATPVTTARSEAPKVDPVTTALPPTVLTVKSTVKIEEKVRNNILLRPYSHTILR